MPGASPVVIDDTNIFLSKKDHWWYPVYSCINRAKNCDFPSFPEENIVCAFSPTVKSLLGYFASNI